MAIKDHLEKLNYFYQVARLGSINEASKVLNITQPSVTKSIKILEDHVGKPLFVRLPRGMKLTLEGQILERYCHKFFTQLEDLEIRLKNPEDPMAGNLRVGTYDSIAIYFWPHFLQKFLKEYPHLNFELTTDRSMAVQKDVESGKLDIGLIIEPRAQAHLETHILAKDFFQLYVAKNLKNKIDDLSGLPLIYMPEALIGESGNTLLQSIYGQESLSAVKHYKTSSLESTKELVISGIGMGLLPRMVAKDAVNKKKIVAIQPKGFPKKGIGEHKIGLVYQKSFRESPLLQELLSRLQAYDW